MICWQHIKIALKHMLSALTGDDAYELEQHMLSQTLKMQGSKACKKTLGLDGFHKQRKLQNPDSSGATAEHEAQLFSKPAAAKKKQGPRQQAEAATANKKN